MPNFWKTISENKMSRAYADLAMYQWNNHGQILPQPQDNHVEIIIDAPSYQKEQELEIQREMSQAPAHQEKVS